MERIKWARKAWKLLGIIFPLIYVFFNQTVTILVLGILSLLFLSFDFLRLKKGWNKFLFKKLDFILKEKEKNAISGTSFFLIGSLLSVFFFKQEVAICAILFLIFGDGVAEIAGKLHGHHHIFGKTLEGSLSCFFTCFLVGAILSSWYPNLTALKVIIGAFGATLIELLPIRINDNLTIPLFSGLLMSVF